MNRGGQDFSFNPHTAAGTGEWAGDSRLAPCHFAEKHNEAAALPHVTVTLITITAAGPGVNCTHSCADINTCLELSTEHSRCTINSVICPSIGMYTDSSAHHRLSYCFTCTSVRIDVRLPGLISEVLHLVALYIVMPIQLNLT